MSLSKDLSGFFDESIEKVNLEDLTQKVESSILQVLKMAHKDARRHRFTKRSKSIQFCCPVCGDSKEDSTKARGHIYLAYGLYKCYNNRNCASSIPDFFRRFDMDNLFSQAELAELEKIAINSRAEIYTTRQAISLTEVDELSPNLFDKTEIISMYQAIEFDKDSFAANKIADRKIPKSKYEMLLWSPNEQCVLILNMHLQTGKVLNMVKRNMRPGSTGPKYLTVPYSDLLAIKNQMRSAFRQPKEPIDMESIAFRSGIPLETIKKLDITCQYYNVLNIDWSDDIYVFEGPIDSFFMPNSLAFGGTGADLKHPTFHYVFDYDQAGRKEAMKRLDNREPVFMWKKFLYDHPEYKKPYGQKTDFNDLYKTKPFSHDMMLPYFTNNPLNKLNV